MSGRRSRLQVGLLAAFVAGLGWLCWFGLRETAVESAAAETSEPPQPAVAMFAGNAPAPARATHVSQVTAESPQAQQPAVQQPSASEPDLDGHPHPITAAHVRIAHELQLIQQLNDALDLRDGARMRPLVDSYARDFPDDPNAMVAGYQRIADCLEDPGDRTRQAAEEYYERERASTLRRYVRRVCLE